MRNLSARERPTPAACRARGDLGPSGLDTGSRTPSLPSDHPDLTGCLDPLDLNLPQGCSAQCMKSECMLRPLWLSPGAGAPVSPGFCHGSPHPLAAQFGGRGVFHSSASLLSGFSHLEMKRWHFAGGGERQRCHGQRSSRLIWGWVMPRIHFPSCNFYLLQPTLGLSPVRE